ncbi:MAG TPA: hypothetical protein PK614_03935 [Nitrospira sp.]|nr:hypothetical protein [Nitrospira sp.]
MIVQLQAAFRSLLGPAFDGYSCGNAAARSDLQKITLKELVKNGWPEETTPLIQTRVTYPENISKNNPDYKCRALLHAKVGERGYESFSFAVYYNYDDYKVTDYKSDFTKYQRMKIADLLAGKLEPLAQKMKVCSQQEKAEGCEDGRDRLH